MYIIGIINCLLINSVKYQKFSILGTSPYYNPCILLISYIFAFSFFALELITTIMRILTMI